MDAFDIGKKNSVVKRIFKSIRWYYHMIFLICSVVIMALFESLYLKTWDFPYFFIFIIGIFVLYVIFFVLTSIFIPQATFIKRGIHDGTK